MKKMTVAEAVNRGLNFFAISLFGIIGIGALHEVIDENDFQDKMEDGFFVVLTLLAVVWYLFSGKAMKKTLIPFYFLLAGFIIKYIGITIESADQVANIPDYEYMGILGLVLIIFFYQFYKDQLLPKK